MPDALILASSSPRRLDLLQQIGVSCKVVPADIDETPIAGESAMDLVQRLAVSKAKTVSEIHPDRLILAADTVVYLSGENEQIFGKPQGRDEALYILSLLSGRSHRVSTCVALYDGGNIRHKVVSTEVTFGNISHAECITYWQSGEPVGKAGAYAIQGQGARFVASIHGSYSNVVGLPLFETSAWLTQAGLNH